MGLLDRIFGVPICCGKPMKHMGVSYVNKKNYFGAIKKVKINRYWCKHCGRTTKI